MNYRPNDDMKRITTPGWDNYSRFIHCFDQKKVVLSIMEEYEKECEKRKARAEKFGTTFVPPKLEDFLPWTEVKRLRDQPKQNAEAGFATGIDLMDSEELAKQEARKARFAKKSEGEETKETSDEKEAAGASADSPSKEAATDKKIEDLPVVQCWDKEEMLGPQRSDPPSSFWNIQPGANESKADEVENREDLTTIEEVTWVPEKIQLFSIDWAAFKQIRNTDLMAFFTGYGPTYVEWLGDLSCNVCFGDQFTAKRALMKLGQEIPSPPPEELTRQDGEESEPRVLPDFGNMTWRFCRWPVRKVRSFDGKLGALLRHVRLYSIICLYCSSDCQ